MTENDYIAEYIKEHHSDLLGFEFSLWKVGRMSAEAVNKIKEALCSIDWGKAMGCMLEGGDNERKV